MEIKFFQKQFKDLSTVEKRNMLYPFICLHSSDSSGLPYFEYLIVDITKEEDKQLLARFNDIEFAKDYIRFLIQNKSN